MHIKKPPKLWPKLLFVIFMLMVSHYAGFVRGSQKTEAIMQDAVAAAWADGYEEGMADKSWKDLAVKNQVYTDKLCQAWWFGTTHLERTINLEGKPKKW